MSDARTLLRTLTLPYESLQTVYEGNCEVRLYRNELTGQLQVGKRLDVLGLEATVAVREGELLQRIRHAHLVPVYDVVQVSGYPSPMQVIEMIMPWYEHGSLFDAFERGERFSIGEAISLMSGGLLGVAELHECHNLLHRDLKSPNFLLAEEDRLVVGDLGVAMPMDGGGTAEALPSGRLYAPPETFTERRLDRRADVYQAGLVLHELASGPFPYEDEALRIEPLARRLELGRRGPTGAHLAHAPWVPSRLRRVINKAVQPQPDKRFASAGEMIEALSKIPYVDWRLVIDEPGRRRWEGATVQRPDRRFAIDARYREPRPRRRAAGWILTGQQHVTRWQRVCPDAIVPDLSGTQAARFFDTMVAIATSR
jgi:serine/threonine protein kinase